MDAFDRITLREIEPSDLEVFFEHQLDPEAIRMAAFVGKDPTDKAAFHAHWAKVLRMPGITQRTIVVDGQVAGHIACFPAGEDKEVTYWLGREFWGQGIATRALQILLRLMAERPILARAASDNLASIRVLEKCGFKRIGTNTDFAHGRGEATEECILRLDADSASGPAFVSGTGGA
jgi:RimJ/RimL family protein N-acetyltransferase